MKAKKYICAYFNDLTNFRLKEYCEDNRINNIVEPFHITLMCSVNEIDLPNIEFSVKPFNVYPEKPDVFGANNNSLVVRLLQSNDLNGLRDVMLRTGLVDTFPDFKPHISLTYDYQGKKLTDLRYPTFPITVTKIKIDDAKN